MGKASSKPQRPAEAFELQDLPSTRATSSAPTQSSRLLTVPIEVRLIIYSFYFSHPIHTVPHTNPPLLSVCALLRREATPTYKVLLHGHWLAWQYRIHDLFAQYLHAYLNSLCGMGVREHQALRLNLKALGRYVVWYSRKVTAMNREGLLDRSDVGLGGRVKLEYVELWKTFFKLPG